MSWWGKVIGGAFGFMMGGPLGALLGAVFGHQFDRGLSGLDEAVDDVPAGDQQRVQMAFFTACFSVMGHMAKADGRVSEDEIAMARQVMGRMQLDEEQKRAAIALFGEGKKPDFPFQEALQQLRREVHGRQTLVRMFIEIQLAAAFADGELHPGEQALLREMAHILGFPVVELEQLMRSAGRSAGGQNAAAPKAMTLEQAYQVLGVSASDNDAQIKRAYRRLLSQHHPDKLVAKGLPEEMMQVATEKTREIREAWELIQAQRSR